MQRDNETYTPTIIEFPVYFVVISELLLLDSFGALSAGFFPFYFEGSFSFVIIQLEGPNSVALVA